VHEAHPERPLVALEVNSNVQIVKLVGFNLQHDSHVTSSNLLKIPTTSHQHSRADVAAHVDRVLIAVLEVVALCELCLLVLVAVGGRVEVLRAGGLVVTVDGADDVEAVDLVESSLGVFVDDELWMVDDPLNDLLGCWQDLNAVCCGGGEGRKS
jgi:hypothetical protein